MKTCLFCLLLFITFGKIAAQSNEESPATTRSFNNNWEFVKDVDTSTFIKLLANSKNTISWQKVSLPHTPQIEPVSKVSEQWQGTCYYRKFFTISVKDKNKHIALQFDAAMQEAAIYVNGKWICKHVGGFLPFEVDISNVVKIGTPNVVLVKLNNQDDLQIPPGKTIKTLDFNFYGGIYRNVWLVVKNKLFISNAVAANREAGGGLLVHDEQVSAKSATLVVKTDIKNENSTTAKTSTRVLLKDKEDKIVGQTTSIEKDISTGEYGSFENVFIMLNPQLWSPARPYLYHVEVQVLQNGGITDQQSITTGIKTFSFKPGGFYLNGQKLNIVGTNRHQEYPYIGYALSDNAQYRDVWKMKEAGLNFVRCSHYPPSPAFLDACDELGIMVMDAIPGWQFFGDEVFQQNSLQNIRDMIRRDRNHASIILWEASLNETGMSNSYMDKATHIVHAELPFKEVYSTGWTDHSYDVFNPARQHAKGPGYWKKYNKKKPLLLAEYGDWEYYAGDAGFNQTAYAGLKKEDRNSRQLRTDGPTRMLQQALNFQEAHNDDLNGPAVGDASWLMFDYKRGYASDIESSGMMDIYRLPKFVFYFYQSQNGPVSTAHSFGAPMVYIANYWNDKTTKMVTVYSNCNEIELLLNDKIIARQQPDKNANTTNLLHPPFTFSIDQFAPGSLQAVGFINGKKAAQAVRLTPGKPFAIQVRIDESGKKLSAGNKDGAFIYASVVDENGTVIPGATNLITFKVVGDAALINANAIHCEAGIASNLLIAGSKAGKIIVTASAVALKTGVLSIAVNEEGIL